jgi:hypothetical protein
MKPRTLVTHRLYFGVDPFKLREAGGRVLARVVGLDAERARVSADDLKRDFGLNTLDGRYLVDEMVAEGLLKPRDTAARHYHVTDRFREYAQARVIEPLPRARARHLVASARELACRINDEWTRNPLEVEALAPFGTYISQEPFLERLPLGIVVRNRPASRRARWRMLSKADGAHEIRGAFKALSTFIQAQLATDLGDLPQPFAVVYQAEQNDPE